VTGPVLIDRPGLMRAWSRDVRRSGHTIALVPTMGALHAGHVSLIERASEIADVTVVSIFVNPLQLGEPADFSGYPRPVDDDIAICARRGVAAIYAPTASTMYPPGFDTRVVPGELANVMEGAARPGHFEGVTTVVTKLFAAAQPDVACFGEKDFQQLAIIRRMCVDLDLGVEIIACPTVRDSDGLALSSRNRRLDARRRTAAACIPAAIDAARRAANDGSSVDEVLRVAQAIIGGEPLASMDYVIVVDAERLARIDDFDPAHRRPGRCRLAIAARFGDVRLIDNIDLFDS